MGCFCFRLVVRVWYYAPISITMFEKFPSASEEPADEETRKNAHEIAKLRAVPGETETYSDHKKRALEELRGKTPVEQAALAEIAKLERAAIEREKTHEGEYNERVRAALDYSQVGKGEKEEGEQEEEKKAA